MDSVNLTDLPVIPCYEGNNCESNFNCGVLNDVEGPIAASDFLDCPDNHNQEPYYGSNPNYCNGIQSCCSDNIDPSELSCDSSGDFTTNGTDNNFIGCTIPEDGSDELGCDSLGKSNCMEFQKFIDTSVDCETPCWVGGGYEVVKNMCQTKIGNDENMCKAMQYYCDWDGSKCTLTRPKEEKDIPWKNFPTYQGTKTFSTSKKCEIADCIQIPSMSQEDSDVSRYVVNTSQSSWDSKKQTSYDPHTRIVCVLDTGPGGINQSDPKKVCITAPRCQYVESNQDCGFISNDGYSKCTDYVINKLDPPCSEEPSSNLNFMCTKVQFQETSGELNSGLRNVVKGTGYCTFCKGIQFKGDYELESDRANDLIRLGENIIPITRDSIDWNTETNRCGNYSECESNGSEELWNKCIYDVSQGEYGINPNDQEFMNSTEEKKRELLRFGGFCHDTTCRKDPNCSVGEIELMNKRTDYINECESQLSYLGSINWGRVMGPGTETSACQYRYHWEHSCILGDDNTPQITENYACTWCPSVQCKIGTKANICSEIIDGEESWNGLPYCNTEAGFGIMTPKSIEKGAPDQCDCFLPKWKDINAPVQVDDNMTTINNVVITSTGVTATALFFFFVMAI